MRTREEFGGTSLDQLIESGYTAGVKYCETPMRGEQTDWGVVVHPRGKCEMEKDVTTVEGTGIIAVKFSCDNNECVFPESVRRAANATINSVEINKSRLARFVRGV